MTRGRWVITIVLLVAVAMGIATWPLLKIRRQNEIARTRATVDRIWDACLHYKSRHGKYPETLESLGLPEWRTRDAWGRPITLTVVYRHHSSEIWTIPVKLKSLGPDPVDSSDDIWKGPERE